MVAQPPAPAARRVPAPRGPRGSRRTVFDAAVFLTAFQPGRDVSVPPTPPERPVPVLAVLVPPAPRPAAAPGVRAGAWAAIALSLVVPAAWRVRGHLLRPSSPALSATTSPACSRSPAALVLLGLGAVTLWRIAPARRATLRRYVRRALIPSAAVVAASSSCCRSASRYVTTHVRAPSCRQTDLGAAHEDVTLHDERRPRAPGLVRPVAERRRGDRRSRAARARSGRRGCSPATATACCSSTAAARASSEGDPNPLGWGGDKDIKAAIAFLQRRPDVDPDRIGGIGLSVGGELMLQTAAGDEGAAGGRLRGRRCAHACARTPADVWASTSGSSLPVRGGHDRGDRRVLQPAPRRRT